MPDGRVARFEVPEGTSPQDAEALFDQHLSSQQKSEPSADMKRMADPTGSFGENLMAGVGKGMTDLARGVGQRLGVVPQEDIDEARKVDKALSETAGGAIGDVVGKTAVAAPLALIPGANTVPGAMIAGAALGAAEPTSGNESALVNTVAGAGMGAAGGFVANKVAGALGARAASKATNAAELQAQNETRDAALQAGRQAGYVVPPSTVKPNVGNTTAESIAGKIPMAHAASVRNQQVTDRLAREAFGMPPDSRLDERVLQVIRARAGQAYEVVKKLPGRFKLDADYENAVTAIGQDFANAAKEFPTIAKNAGVEALKTDLGVVSQYGRTIRLKQDMSPAAMIEAVKKLRFDAAKNYRSFDDPAKAELAKAQRAAATALDDLIQRNLAGSGRQNLAQQYVEARQVIAKAHDVEAALMPDGHIDSRVLVKIAADGPMSGPLKVISDFAGSFPKASAPVSTLGSPGVHNLRAWGAAAAGAGGFAAGGPVGAAMGAAAPFVVPASVRSAMLSRLGQRALATPNYSAAGARRLASAMGNKYVQRAAPVVPQEIEQE